MGGGRWAVGGGNLLRVQAPDGIVPMWLKAGEGVRLDEEEKL